MSTVAQMIAALGTYPGDAEVWLDYDPYTGANSLHIHPMTSELECHQFWDGMTPPVRYGPTLKVYEITADEAWVEEL